MPDTHTLSLNLPRFGLGGGPIGGLTRDMTNEDARKLLEAAWDGGLRYFDTAPWYGNTHSEHRVGSFLREKSRDSFILTTKVGRLYRKPDRGFDFENSKWRARWPGGLPMVPILDYSYDGIMRSYEDSIQRTGITRFDALAIHDLDIRHLQTEERVSAAFGQLASSGFRALSELKGVGEIQAIGAGINFSGYIGRFLKEFDLDYFLVAMPYTLADQSILHTELPLCEKHGAQVIVGAPFASGMLASGARPDAKFNYAEPTAEARSKVNAIRAVCTRHSVSMSAAALRFPLGHSAVTSVVFGAETDQQVADNIAATTEPITEGFWEDLRAEKLISPDAPIPPSAA